MSEENERRRQENLETGNSVVERVEMLEGRGWASDDAGRYVELHQIWLRTELAETEIAHARALEEKYSSPGNFGVFKDKGKPETEVDPNI